MNGEMSMSEKEGACSPPSEQ